MDEIVIKLSVDGTTGNVSLQATDANIQKLIKTVKEGDKATTTFSQNFVKGFQDMRNLGQGYQQLEGMISGVFGTGISKSMEYGLAMAKLSGVIRSSGKEHEVSLASMEQNAVALSKEGLAYKSEIINVERYLLSFKNIRGNADEATKAAMGLATVLDTDLRGGTIALAKALDQGSEGMKALNRQGLKLSADEMDHVKQLEDEGKTYQMQSYILTLLASKYKDVNEEIRKTDAFKVNQAEKALADMQKQAGTLEMMAINPLLTGVGNMLNLFNQLPVPVRGATVMLTQMTVAYGILNSTGIGATIKNLLFYDFGLKANTIAKLENMIMTKQMTAAEQTHALAAYESAIATKGFFASMGPVGWAIIAVGALATAWGLLDMAVGKTNAAMGDDERKLREQQNDYKRLSAVIKDTTASETDRSAAMKELGEKFGDLIPLSKLENATEAEKNKILATGNDLLIERIKIKSQEKVLQEASDKLVQSQVERDKKKDEYDAVKNKKEEKQVSGGQASGIMGVGNIPKVSVKGLAESALLNAEEEVKNNQKALDQLMKSFRTKDEEGTVEERVNTKLEETTKIKIAGWTGEKIDKYSKALKDLEPKLVVGSELQKKVNARVKELDDTRFGKTGGNGLGYLAEDAKLDLASTDKIEKMYTTINEKWGEISKISLVDKKGNADTDKTDQQRQKAKFKLRDEMEKSIETLMKDNIKSAEVNGEAAGEDKIQIGKDKMAAMQQVMEEVNKQAVIWEQKGRGDFPIISNQKMNEWKIEVIKTQNEINKETFDAGVKLFSNDEDLIARRMEIENAGDMAKLLLKQNYLQKELQLAEDFHQTEKAEELRHKLEMNDLEKQDVAKKMMERSRQHSYDMQISKANRTYNEFGSDTLNEMKNYEEGQQRIKEDPLLTEKQKNEALVELTDSTQQRMLDIKRKYYDAWLGELAGLSKQEIEAISNIISQVSAGANAFMEMGSRRGQEDADNYRKTENAKLDTQKKAALAGARTEQQKAKIEEQFAKKKEKIDEEANKKGQERIKTTFVIQQAAGIAGAAISTYKGAAAALEPPPIGAGPILGPFLMAATIITGLAQVAAIGSQPPPKFATGGLPAAILKYIYRPSGIIDGPGTGTSDSILARISKEEFIVNAAATKKHLPWLEQINSNKFSGGGLAGGSSYSSSNFYYPKSDNGELIREMQSMSSEMRGMRAELKRHLENPTPARAFLDDNEAKKIYIKGKTKQGGSYL